MAQYCKDCSNWERENEDSAWGRCKNGGMTKEYKSCEHFDRRK